VFAFHFLLEMEHGRMLTVKHGESAQNEVRNSDRYWRFWYPAAPPPFLAGPS
jgi:hypothetical protein